MLDAASHPPASALSRTPCLSHDRVGQACHQPGAAFPFFDNRTLVMTKQPEYKGIVDVAGTVGQFLLNTSESDLIVELIQNELDARSSRTCIRVLDDRLVCEGNGRNIETAGWKRLKFILAAGGKVTPKQGGIGAKNHGLRVAFWIGDTIHVQSGGQRTQLTTCSNPSKAKFDPGA
jgi:predicted flavoprotein YhiN